MGGPVAREVLVRTRTRLINHLRDAVKFAGRRVPRCSRASFHRTATEAIPEGLKPAFEPLLKLLERVSEEILAYDCRIGKLASEDYPENGAMMQVAGVGSTTALAFLPTIEDSGRFSKSRAVGPYHGLRTSSPNAT